jgi:ATP-dependent DNA helicase RecG
MAGLMLTFRANPAHLQAADLEQGRGTTPVAAQETAQETAQEKVLAQLRAQPFITRRELANKLGLSDSGIKYHLEKLKAAGLIRHVGATKAGYWEVVKGHRSIE